MTVIRGRELGTFDVAPDGTSVSIRTQGASASTEAGGIVSS